MTDETQPVSLVPESATVPEAEALSGLVIDGLARLPGKALLDEAAMAQLLAVTPRTIRRMVSRFELPPPVPLGGHSVWLAGKVLSHIGAAADRAAREAESRARKIGDLAP